MDKHKMDQCFINPKCPAYRPEIRERRLAQAKKRNITIPAHILADGDVPAAAVTALKHNFLTEDEAEGIAQSMCLMGSIQPGEKEAVKERLIFMGEETPV